MLLSRLTLSRLNPSRLTLAALLLPVLTVSCGSHACATLPACIETRNNEVQPSGTVIGALDIQPGQSGAAVLTVGRAGLPPGDPLVFVPLILSPGPQQDTLIARSREGIEVRADRSPFSADRVPLDVRVPAGLVAGNYIVYLKLRRVKSIYPDTTGPAGLTVVVN